jgi:peptidoglycan/xylan/chitin deacetylase (PgdA/CDA1 family)
MNNCIKKLACFLFYQGFYRWKVSRLSLVVLTYHRISEVPDPNDPLKISASTFEKQIRFLKSNYSIASGEEISAAFRGLHQLPNNSCVITFDDGWQDNYSIGFPILKKYQAPALIFLSTDYIGTGKIFWHNKLRKILNEEDSGCSAVKIIDQYWPYELAKNIKVIYQLPIEQRGNSINELIERMKTLTLVQIESLISCLSSLLNIASLNDECSMLSWEQVAEMSKNGIIFGSHSKSHSILTKLDADSVRIEIEDSKKVLEKRLKQTITFIAYPNGNFDKRIILAAKDAGFQAGFTCEPGINRNFNRPFELKRINMREDSSSGLSGSFSCPLFKMELSGAMFYIKDLLKWIRPNQKEKLRQQQYTKINGKVL